MHPMEQGWLENLGPTLLALLPGGLFCVWCLWGIDWKKASPLLNRGGWLPLLILAAFAAGVWAAIWPSTAKVLGVFHVPNGWWQIGSVSVLLGTGLFLGWLQKRLGHIPHEVNFEPPAHHHDDHHGHDHHHHDHHDSIDEHHAIAHEPTNHGHHASH